MNNTMMTYLGGLIGGYGLLHIPVSATFLASLTPLFTIIGVLAMTLFAGALIYKGIQQLFL